MERQAYTNPDTAFDNDLLMSSDIINGGAELPGDDDLRAFDLEGLTDEPAPFLRRAWANYHCNGKSSLFNHSTPKDPSHEW